MSPVPKRLIDEVLGVAPRQIATMIRLQCLTGMRPGEVVTMGTGDLDRTSKIWAYKPGSHKTEHHGRKRIINKAVNQPEIPSLRISDGA